jgi:hypothetical protein
MEPLADEAGQPHIFAAAQLVVLILIEAVEEPHRIRRPGLAVRSARPTTPIARAPRRITIAGWTIVGTVWPLCRIGSCDGIRSWTRTRTALPSRPAPTFGIAPGGPSALGSSRREERLHAAANCLPLGAVQLAVAVCVEGRQDSLFQFRIGRRRSAPIRLLGGDRQG